MLYVFIKYTKKDGEVIEDSVRGKSEKRFDTNQFLPCNSYISPYGMRLFDWIRSKMFTNENAKLNAN